MRILFLVVLLSPLALAGCGHGELPDGTTRWHDDVCVEC